MVELQNENELIDQAQLNPQNFGKLYEYYFPKIYNYVRCRVPDLDIADDTTSKVFAKVIDNLDKFDATKGSFSTWIFTIAHNTVVDYYKKRSKDSNVSLEIVANKACEEVNLESELVNKELKENLLLALGELKERKRNIIALKFWGGLTNRKIAKITGLSESNVGVIVYRTMKKLRAMLEERRVI